MRVRYLREARHDLDNIAFYISLDNHDAARRTVEGIIGRLRVLASFPGAGRERNDFHRGLRSWAINNYVAFYIVADTEVKSCAFFTVVVTCSAFSAKENRSRMGVSIVSAEPERKPDGTFAERHDR